MNRNGLFENDRLISRKEIKRGVYRLSPALKELLDKWHNKVVNESGIPMTKSQTEYMLAKKIEKFLNENFDYQKNRTRGKSQLIFKL